MKDNTSFDAIIVGAGIAGLTLAEALMSKGYNCAIVDKGSPGSGASGAPKLLINPATGRRAKMSPGSEQALPEIMSLLEKVQQSTKETVYEKNGVIRPALSDDIAKDFKKSPNKYPWPDGWITWLDQKEFTNRYPVFQHNKGGLLVDEGATVNGNIFIDSLSKLLSECGLITFYNSVYEYSYSNDKWTFLINGSESITADSVIFATGQSLTKDPNWDFLKLHPIKGQTAEFTFSKPLPFDRSVSSLGYMAYFSSEPNKLVVGSTYEHHFDHLNPDKDGLEYLKTKLENTLPGWTDKIIHADQWAGVRVTAKDKKPVIGAHPSIPNLYIFGGLASKGMLLGRYCALRLADHIVSGEPI